MATVSAQRLLQQEIRALPDDLTVEVLDFVQFLKARRAEDGFLWQQVEETRALPGTASGRSLDCFGG